jgi:hypothetical protein
VAVKLKLVVLSASQVTLGGTVGSVGANNCSAAVSGTGTTTRTIVVTGCNPAASGTLNVTIAQNSAFNAAGFGASASSTSANATVTIPAPSAPSVLGATAGAMQVALGWTDNSSNESGFIISRSTDNVSFSDIHTTAADATSYTNTGLTGGQIYYYKVRATNAGGDSADSNTASATPWDAPVLASLTIDNTSPTNSTTYVLTFGSITGAYNRYCILENDTDESHCAYTTATVPASKVVSVTNNAKVLSVWLKNAAGYISNRVDSNSVTLDTVAPILASADITNASPTNTQTYNLTYGSITNTYNRYCILENDTVEANCTYVTAALPSTFSVDATEEAKVLSIWLKDSAGNISARVDTDSVTLDLPDEITGWTDVANVALTNGINYSTAKDGTAPTGVSFNSKLYAAWQEVGENGATDYKQIRVAVYNGNDSSPGWTRVDGNGVNGINKVVTVDAINPYLAVHNSKLYITWAEGTTKNIRVAEYNGNDGAPAWTFIDGNAASVGINKDSAKAADYPVMVSFDSKLYVAWRELGENGATDYTQIRVKYWDNTSWSWADGGGVNGINIVVTNHAQKPRFAILAGAPSKLYLAWLENNGTRRVRVRAYGGGGSWTTADGGGTGLNVSGAVTYGDQGLDAVGFDSKIWVVWEEAGLIRIKNYDGSNDAAPTWTAKDAAGLNHVVTDPAYSPVLAVSNNKIYAGWPETSSTNSQDQFRLKVYSAATTWNSVDGGVALSQLNTDTSASALYPLLVPFNSKLYALTDESGGADATQRQVCVKSGE